MMDALLSIRVFAVVAETKNSVTVAVGGGLTNAMTSKPIQHIEKQLGAWLLKRSSRKVCLTEALAHGSFMSADVVGSAGNNPAQWATMASGRSVSPKRIPCRSSSPFVLRTCGANSLNWPTSRKMPQTQT